MAIFFSSRIRHTISTRDLSSDVCSSDLFVITSHAYFDFIKASDLAPQIKKIVAKVDFNKQKSLETGSKEVQKRSEERRVGKECRLGEYLNTQMRNFHGDWTRECLSI